MPAFGLAWAVALWAAASAPAPIVPPGPPPPPPPRLVVAISVDQLSAELFEQYRASFASGFKRLQLGIGFLNAYQGHASSETCPGHSTMLTGTRPSTNGIIANGWIDQRAARSDKNIYCAEDERAPGSTFAKYSVSPAHLRVATLGDRMKEAAPAARNVAVAGKDRSAVMMGGRVVDQRWYWDGSRFATDRKTGAPPRSVTAVNAVLNRRLAAPSAALDPPPLCAARAKPYAVTPELSVGAGRLDRAAGDQRAFRAHPDLDGAVLALAAGLVEELRLGRGAAVTDLVSIGLSATDYVGHRYGNGGQEMCLQLLALDRELGDFFAQLDRTGVDYAVVLTADHGAMDIAERLRDRGVPQAARVDPALLAATVGKAIGAELGIAGPVLLGETSGDMWLAATLNTKDRARALAAAVRRYRAHPQVAAVFTKGDLARTRLPAGKVRDWDLQARARTSFDTERSGDLVVLLKPYISPIAKPAPGYVAGHGSPWDYDRRVPLLFWRRGMAATSSAEQVEIIDILPTVAAMIGLPLDSRTIDGRCLRIVAGDRCPPR